MDVVLPFLLLFDGGAGAWLARRLLLPLPPVLLEPLEHLVPVLVGGDVGLEDDLGGALGLGEGMVGALTVGVGVPVLTPQGRAHEWLFARMQPLNKEKHVYEFFTTKKN